MKPTEFIEQYCVVQTKHGYQPIRLSSKQKAFLRFLKRKHTISVKK